MSRAAFASGDAPMLSPKEFARVAAIAHREAGLCLSEAKHAMISSRLSRRLRATGHQTFSDYLAFLEARGGDAERQMLISALTTNVSHFFREKHHFDMLETAILASKLRSGGRLRIWSAGCSTGQEPYSIAMTILRALPDAASLDIKVLATDIDETVLATAREGIYGDRQLDAVDAASRARFFAPVSDGRQAIKPEVRSLISFKPLNLIAPWPVQGPFDAIFCRNVVIYFDAATQAALWPRFQKALSSDGLLFLGHSERLDPASGKSFASVGVTTYRKLQGALPSQANEGGAG